MLEKQFTVINDIGIHARPASLLVRAANQYQSHITISYGTKTTNLKSILGVMSFAIKPGANFIIRAKGKDENEAIIGITNTLKEEGIAEIRGISR